MNIKSNNKSWIKIENKIQLNKIYLKKINYNKIHKFSEILQFALIYTNACVNPDLNPLQHKGDVKAELQKTSIILDYGTVDGKIFFTTNF